jgi:hypothetical protein
MNFHTLIAQESKSTTHIDSSRTQQDINRTNSPNKKNKKNILGEPFTDYYSTQTTYVHSIAVGSGDKFKAVSYLTYKQDGELVNDTERAYFFFFGGSAGLTFFITQRIFLHFAGGAEYWFGDTPSGYGYIYEYRDGYDESGGWKPMYTIGLNSILPLSKRSTTSLGLAYSNNSFQYQTFSLVFTFY